MGKGSKLSSLEGDIWNRKEIQWLKHKNKGNGRKWDEKNQKRNKDRKKKKEKERGNEISSMHTVQSRSASGRESDLYVKTDPYRKITNYEQLCCVSKHTHRGRYQYMKLFCLLRAVEAGTGHPLSCHRQETAKGKGFGL